MSAKPEQHLKVGDWWYLPQQDKLVKIDEAGDISETASLDNLCQKALNYFLVNAGRLITRDELLSDVWGGAATFRTGASPELSVFCALRLAMTVANRVISKLFLNAVSVLLHRYLR